MRAKFDNNQFFTAQLLRWNKLYNTRLMPWKGETDAYKIWLSEIILQQTRVEQGLAYYNRFIKKFPTIHHLAKAPEATVFKLWEGLGYYTRCKNLIATAKYISTELQGRFPDKYEDILALKGIGPYTAAAISSFAFNLPHAVVDGNVFRVLSRFFGIDTPIDSTEGKKSFTQLANQLLDKKQPGIYNQALMDFGAVICKPQQPLCNECLLNSQCAAVLKGLVNQLPVKEKSITKKERWFYYLIIEHDDLIYVRKRTGKDIWQNLHEFVLIEKQKEVSLENLYAGKDFNLLIGKNKFMVINQSGIMRQLLTHQTIRGQFIHIKINSPLHLEGYEALSQKDIAKLAFPQFINNYLQNR